MSSLGMRLTRRTREDRKVALHELADKHTIARQKPKTHTHTQKATDSAKPDLTVNRHKATVVTLLLCCLSTYFTSVRVSSKFRNGTMSFLSLLLHSLVFYRSSWHDLYCLVRLDDEMLLFQKNMFL